MSATRPRTGCGRSGRPTRRAVGLPALVGAVLALAITAGCAERAGTPGSAVEADDADPSSAVTGAAAGGELLVQQRCTGCHPITQATSHRGDAAEWAAVVDRMIAKGAKLSAEEREEVISYLAESFP